MISWLFTLLVPVLIALVWHGLTLKVAVALAGEEAPGFLRTAWVSWLGGLAGGTAALAWTYTLGLMVWFFSSWLSAGVALILHVAVTTLIYKRGLRLSMPASIGVTVIHMVLSMLLNGALGWYAYSTMF